MANAAILTQPEIETDQSLETGILTDPSQPPAQQTPCPTDAQPRTPARVPVRLPSASVTIEESASQVFQVMSNLRTMFNREGTTVEVIQKADGVEIHPLNAVAAQSRFETPIQFMTVKWLNGQFIPQPAKLSKEVSEQYLHSQACRKILPKLTGLLNCPLVVNRKGRCHRVSTGYDSETGLYVAGGVEPDEVQIAEAVEYLSGMLQDFDFVTAGDRSRAIASLITPALKLGGFISGPLPIDVAEADASQSGKTYRQKLVAAVYNQKLAVVTKRSGGVGGMEETLMEHLVKGRTFIQFDNVRGTMDSQYLESFLTADENITARIPYHGNIMIDPSKFILFLTSNGFEATKDLANRASIIRIRRRERYEFRDFGGMDLLQFVRQEQPLFLGSVFAVLAEWDRQGRVKTKEKRHDFREWAQILDWIVQHIFGEGPLMDDHEEAKERAADPQLSFIRSIAMLLHEKSRLAEALTASNITELCMEEELEIPGLATDKQTLENGRQQVGKIMGKLFETANERNVEGYRVRKTETQESTANGNAQPVKRYTFTTIQATRETEQPASPPRRPLPSYQGESRKADQAECE
jgi:hypothetical protein